MEGDVLYFSRRAKEARAAAMKAASSAARDAHLDMAARYEELAESIAAREQYLGLDAVGAARAPS